MIYVFHDLVGQEGIEPSEHVILSNAAMPIRVLSQFGSRGENRTLMPFGTSA